jgi:hypothetical protein
MFRNCFTLTSILLMLGFLRFVTPAHAADYYIGPDACDPNYQNECTGSFGNDSWPGTLTQPFKTFTKAWSVMTGGDTVYLLDGIYYQSLAPTINGALNPTIDPTDIQTYPLDSPERTAYYIKVKALHDGQTIIDGHADHQAYLNRNDPVHIPVSLNYIGNYGGGYYFWIEGIVARNSSESVFALNAKNLVIKRVTGINAHPYKNVHVFTMNTGGDVTNPSNVLIEDAFATGSGRKMFLVFSSYVNVVLRRVVGLHQAVWYGGIGSDPNQPYCGEFWQQTDNIEIYNWAQPDLTGTNMQNTIFENVIALGGNASYGINVTPNPSSGSTQFNSVLGSISLNNGMNYDQSNKAWRCSDIPDQCYSTRCHEFDQWVTHRSGFSGGIYSRPSFRNNLWQDIFAANNGSVGMVVGPWADGTYPSTNPRPASINNIVRRATLVNNTQGIPQPNRAQAGTNLIDDTGANADLTDQFAIEDSYIPGTSYSGAGANLTYQYQNGSETTNPLWPIPMQDRILEESGIDVTGTVTSVLQQYNTPSGSTIAMPVISPLPAQPVTNLNPGKFNVGYLNPITITLSHSDPTAIIRYSLDGTEPTSNSTQYTTPITLNSATLVKAKAFIGSESSHTKSAYYRFKSQSNQPPVVEANVTLVMDDFTQVVLPRNRVELYGQVEDFTFPNPWSELDVNWTQVAGPGQVVITEPNKPRTSATFPTNGLYTLRLAASDGAFTTSDDIQVQVWPANLSGIVFDIPGKIEAENYRSGGEGIGYHNTNGYGDTIYRGGPVDMEFADKEGAEYATTYFYPGEWLAYDVNITQTGTYDLNFRTAIAISGGSAHIEFETKDQNPTLVATSPPINLVGRNTNRLQDYETITVPITIDQTGSLTMKLIADNPATNATHLHVGINYLEFVPAGQTTNPGDTDGDLDVDLVDYQTLLDEFNTTNCGGSCVADFDNDGSITIFDFNILVTHFGTW